MDKIITYLKQLELSDIEAKLYLALLRSGALGVKELAEKVDVKRTTAYFYIDQLIEKDLVIKIVKGSKKQVTAVDPQENLNDLVRKKLQSAEKTQKQLPEMLAMINTMSPNEQDIDDAEITFYKGEQSVKNIYKKALQAKELRTYVKVEASDGLFANNVNIFIDSLKKHPQLKIREIIYDSPFATKDAQQIAAKSKNYTYKLMPKELKLTTGDMLMYDGSVAIINYSDQINCVVLKNTDYYTNSREIFDFIWRTIP